MVLSFGSGGGVEWLNEYNYNKEAGEYNLVLSREISIPYGLQSF
jgi:hypothetical protein